MARIIDDEFIYDEDDMASMSEYTGIVPHALTEDEAENVSKDLHVNRPTYL